VYNNNLNGTIPSEMGRLQNLNWLYDDKLVAPWLIRARPIILSFFPFLLSISHLYNNPLLYGTIPTQLFASSNLKEMYLRNQH
jgi:hypothetical protein